MICLEKPRPEGSHEGTPNKSPETGQEVSMRAMRRFRQQITEADCEELLKNERRGALCLNGDDGYPYGLPINYYYEDGCVYFHGAREGAKIDAIRNSDRASFVVWEKGVPAEVRGFVVRSVIAFGRISVMDDAAEAEDKLRKLGLKYFPEEPDYIEKEIGNSKGRAVMLRLRIEHMTGKRVNES